jgi:hypothetical protein
MTQRPLLDNTQHSQETIMPLVWFEPTTPPSERPQTHALDLAVSWIGTSKHILDISLKRKTLSSIYFSPVYFSLSSFSPTLYESKHFYGNRKWKHKELEEYCFNTIPVIGMNVVRILQWRGLKCPISVSVYWNVHSRLNKWTNRFFCKSDLIVCCRELMWLCSIRACHISVVSCHSIWLLHNIPE